MCNIRHNNNNNNKVDFREMGKEDANWIQLAQGRVK
jgi:hypothetical protein